MTLHLVTGSDDNYAAGVMVLIASAAFHTPDLRATVLDNGISTENRARIDALGAALGIKLDRIEIDADAFADLAVRRGHLTRSTYLRLLIPDLMPDADRVVYMDCDMVVTDDLSPLAALPLGDAVVAAVPDPSPDAAELTSTGIARGDYVNAGLLVMNLPVWRSDGIAARCLALLSDPVRPLLSEDQSALNIAAKGRIAMLPGRFNVYADPAGYAAPKEMPRDPAVVHYVVNHKPWLAPAPLGAVWHAHAARLADLMPPAPALTWARRLSLWNTRRKLAAGLLTGRQKYRQRLRVMRAQAALQRAYLARLSGRCRVQLILARQHEGQIAFAHQRQPFAVDAVDGIQRIHARHLIAHLVGQAVGRHAADIDGVAVARVEAGVNALVEIMVGHRSVPSLAPFQSPGSPAADRNGLDDRLRRDPPQINMQKPVLHPGVFDLDPLGQHEAALKGARRDAAMQEDAVVGGVLILGGLTAPDHQLAVLYGQGQVVLGKARDGQRDAESVRRPMLDIIGRIALGPLGGAFGQPLKLVETQQIGMRPQRHLRHRRPSGSSDCVGQAPLRLPAPKTNM